MSEAWFPSHLRNRITESLCWGAVRLFAVRNLWQKKLRFFMRLCCVALLVIDERFMNFCCLFFWKGVWVENWSKCGIDCATINMKFLFLSLRFSLTIRWQQRSSIHRRHRWWLMNLSATRTRSMRIFTVALIPAVHHRSFWPLCHWVSDLWLAMSNKQWNWCYMSFRFNAIRQLSAAEGKRNDFWARHHQDNSIAIVCIERWKHLHIKSRIRWRRLFETRHWRGESTVEQRGNARNWFVVLSVGATLNSSAFRKTRFVASNYLLLV